MPSFVPPAAGSPNLPGDDMKKRLLPGSLAEVSVPGARIGMSEKDTGTNDVATAPSRMQNHIKRYDSDPCQ